MAFSHAQGPSTNITAGASSQILTVANPAPGQVLMCGIVTANATATPVFTNPTDNGSSGWNLHQPATVIGSFNATSVWWKTATSTDASFLTSITFSWTNGSTVTGGVCFMDEYDGFSGTPTLDLSPPPVTNNSTESNIVYYTSATNSTELAVNVALAPTAMGAVLGYNNFYTPNNLSTEYSLTSVQDAGTFSLRGFANSVLAASAPEQWVASWTTSVPFAAYGATFYDGGGLAVPGAPVVTSVVPSNQSVTLSWTAPTSGGAPTSYTIIQTGYASANYSGIVSLQTFIQGLVNGQSYTFGVEGINSAGTGAESNTESATPQAALTAPGPPTLLSAVAGNASVALTWQAPSTGGAPTSYTVFQTGFASQTIPGVSGLTYTVLSLTNGDSYTFAIAGINSAGTGSESNTISATPEALASSMLFAIKLHP